MKRSTFVGSSLATAGALAVGMPAMAQPGVDPSVRVGGALVLAGGGAKGAYEAGWIEGLRRAGSVADGSPLPSLDVVCGTSIGSINAWFVATAQYSRLAELWHGIARSDVFRLKHRFAATSNPHAFIVAKIIAALSLAQGLTKNVQGLLDGDVVQSWIDANLDPHTPLVTPLIFTATNLDRQRAELFFQLPPALPTQTPQVVMDRVKRQVGPDVPLRPADASIFSHAIRASTAIPVLFDPIVLTSPEGTADRYIDGGISDNDPIDIARSVARNVYLISCDPNGISREPYANALEIVVGAFSVAEQRIFEASLRDTAEQTAAKRLFEKSTLTAEQRRFFDNVLDADLFIGRPASQLPVETVSLDRQDQIDAAYALGLDDAMKGWTPYRGGKAQA